MSGGGSAHDRWSAGDSYEAYMGRWSRQIAHAFVAGLDVPGGADWIDVGCGTGALTRSVLELAGPSSVVGVDPSEGFVAHAAAHVGDARARFVVGGAEALPLEDGCADAAVSALALNFVPDRGAALAEMVRILRPGGMLAWYVWDYPGGGMGMIDVFWRVAERLDPAAATLNEARRFPFCTAEGLAADLARAGLTGGVVEAIEKTAVFPDFDAFWQPFTLGAGPAPGYLAALSPERRDALRAAVAAELPAAGEIRLPVRAWSARAPRPVQEH